jgi:hypothetical protein
MLENTGGIMKKENLEKLATLDIQETRQINVREYLKGNEKEQSRKNWQHRKY